MTMRNHFFSVVLLLPALSIVTAESSAQDLPPGFTATTLVSSGINSPTCLCLAPDDRIFIGTQNGDVRIWKASIGLLPTPFYQFNAIGVGEMGLMGMALDPDFEFNGYVYADYTPLSISENQRIVRIRASTAAADLAEPDSESVLIDTGHRSVSHNGGCLQFGSDGKLYIGVGEQGTHGTQDINTLQGKILRINSDGSIPSDNPTHFDGIDGSPIGINRAIWAIGLRNPFRFTFQPDTARMFINDVGQDQFEEIDDGAPGRNFGWSETEGPFDTATYPMLTPPFYSYPHPYNTSACILAGAFYNPEVSTFPPEYYGDYFFADIRSWLKRLDIDSRVVRVFASGTSFVTDLRIDSIGRMYFLIYRVSGEGSLVRIEYTDPLPPVVVRQPKPQILCDGDAARLSLVVSASLPVSYQWQRNGVDIADVLGISGSQTRELKIRSVHPGHAGDYRCVIHNAYGDTQTSSVVLSVGPAASGYDGSFVQAFADALLNHSQAPGDLCRFDFDGSGAVDAGDVAPMVAALLAA